MNAVVKTEDAGLRLLRVPRPEIGAFDVLISVDAAGICGSDIAIDLWEDPWVRNTVKPGQVVGHEFCGVVVEVGRCVKEPQVGEFVTAESHIWCGECHYCRTGAAHICPRQQVLGFDHAGAFADFVSVPARNVVRLPNFPPEVAAIQDAFANATHAALTVPLTNAVVLVTGCGPLGLMVIALARRLGARLVAATDPSSYRRTLATQLGAHMVLEPADVALLGPMGARSISGSGVDVWIEMSGSSRAIRDGFGALRPGGNAILVGLPPAPTQLDLAADVILKAITVHGVVGRRIYESWEQAFSFLVEGSEKPVALGPLITHRFPLREFERAFALARTRQCGKIILFPND